VLKIKIMKAHTIFFGTCLMSILFSSCSDDFDLEFPAPNPASTSYRPAPVVIALNPTEQRLRGTWFLRTMATKDTLYNDSVLNHNRTIEFTDMAYPGSGKPVLYDYAVLYAKATPDIFLISANEEYSAPDSLTFKIYFSGYYLGPDSVKFKIGSLTYNELTLLDTIEQKSWKFIR
jgi:hypothetical protein